MNTTFSSCRLFGTFCLSIGLLLSGCSGGSGVPSADEIQKALDTGRLDRAQLLLGSVPTEGRSTDYGSVAASVRSALDKRSTQRAELAAATDRTDVVKQRQMLDELRALKRRVVDRQLKLEIDETMSRLPALYAEARARQKSQKRSGFGVAPMSTPASEQSKLPVVQPITSLLANVSASGASTSKPAHAPQTEVKLAGLTESSDQGERATEPTDARGWRKLARREQAAEHLAEARAAYLNSAELEVRQSMRDADLTEVNALEDRNLLREELVALYSQTPGAFPKVELLSTDSLTISGVENAWQALDGRAWTRLVGEVDLSVRAELGLIRERFLSDDEHTACRDLRRLRKADRITDADVTDVVAQSRGEVRPVDGYVWHGGGYMSQSELRRKQEAEELARVTKVFASVRLGDDLDPAWSDLFALATESESASALLYRHERVLDRLERDKSIQRVERVADFRRSLDAARAAAIELIFDETEYFYPYNPPECPPEKAKDYPDVQRRVDLLVGSVRDVWNDKTSVKLNGKSVSTLLELRWLRERATEVETELEWPASVPAVLEHLNLERGPITLATFSWDEAEATRLEYNDQVRALNDERWSIGLQDAGENDLEALAIEQRQVQITNEYRLMFGRRAVAWNPRLQRSAQDHSRYMADTGDFGHYETNPETKTPFDRMERRGYTDGRSENCYMGSGDAMAAHMGWVSSSGHHRNLLMPGHRELGSAVSGNYWTQNFGTGDEFRSELR